MITRLPDPYPENLYEAERIPTHLQLLRESGVKLARITVDKLEVAAFIYLLLNNRAIRDVLDTITSKAVLILGRFTQQRKRVLNALRDGLRERNYLPILFDFVGPMSRDTTEIISTLAHLARFVIADITDARSVPQELMKIVPQLPSVPIQPLISRGEPEYAMFKDLRRYPWVLNTVDYDPEDSTPDAILAAAVRAAERWLEAQRANGLEARPNT